MNDICRNMKLIYLFLVFFSVSIIVGCSQINENAIEDVQNQDNIFIWGLTSFSDIGIVTANNGPIRLIDASSGETLVLCDRPDCRHEVGQAIECLAIIEDLHAFVIYNGHQVFIKTKEGEPMTLEVFTADINGHNRRLVSEIADIATSIFAVIIQDGKLIFSFRAQYELDEMGLLQDRDSIRTGIIAVNIETGETNILAEHDAEGAVVNDIYLRGNSLYFSYQAFDNAFDYDYMMELMMEDIATWSLGGESTDLAGDYMRHHLIASIFRVDLDSGEETLIWQWQADDDSNLFMEVTGFAGGYAVILKRGPAGLDILSLEDRAIKELIAIDNGTENGVFAVSNNEELFYGVVNTASDEQSIYSFNFETSTSEQIKSLGQMETRILSIHNDVVFTFGLDDDGEMYYGIISREDFLDGNFENHRIILFPNEEWGR